MRTARIGYLVLFKTGRIAKCAPADNIERLTIPRLKGGFSEQYRTS